MAASHSPNHTAAASSAVPEHHVHHHHRHKKSTDPFLTRRLTAEVSQQFRQPSPSQANDGTEHDNSSVVADLIITPLTMISFVFSLVLIDRQQRRWRLSQHNADTTAGWSGAWRDPEPYQATSSPGQENDRPAAEKGHDTNAYSGWYTRKKKRAMARMEISDALELRKRVVVALVVWLALVFAGTYYVFRYVYSWVLRG